MAETAVIETRFGEIEITLFDKTAPKTVENFVKLAKSGFYKDLNFHLVIANFMIQGGCPNTKDASKGKGAHGTGDAGYKIKAEFNDTSHKRGIVSMARSQDPNSAGSQFFIVVADSTFLDRQYTAFGKVVRGIEVADKIVAAPRDSGDNPDERVEMKVRVAGAA